MTRAVRIAKLAPGQPVPVIVIGRYSCKGSPTSDNTTRSEVFDRLKELSDLMPDMRCAQLIAAIGELCSDLHGRGLWDASDAELLEAIWQFRRNYEAATAGTGSTQRGG